MSLKDYNQAVNDTNAIRKRLLKYVGPSFLTALAFNIVKFFEAKVTDMFIKFFFVFIFNNFESRKIQTKKYLF